ncbi:MAG TPA: methylated-DNA--[protein]-cysteine S-methyltransferase [Solimonas sp.]|nr:methylated-DNA--[protein]-cysteine S-methyltransferase [Solimonas sp.]
MTATPATAVEARLQALCRHIEAHADQELSLEALAARAHLSPYHLQRRFKALTGLSPKQYQEGVRLRRLRQELRQGQPVTRAIQDAGFGSASRVYEKVATRLGMTPKQYRAGGAGLAISYAAADTPLGRLMMGATDRGLCFVQFGDSDAALRAQLQAEYPGAQLAAMDAAMHALFEGWMRALGAHLAGRASSPALPLDLRGTAFQMRVWRYLQQIPAGELRSYREVAEAIGAPRAVRAVASACARNRIALLVPCHRVIRGDGSLGGYKWGLERKRVLIDQERRGRGA